MLRKLIITSLLVVIYNGSAPHLIGSLITTFIFITLHLQVFVFCETRRGYIISLRRQCNR